MSIDKNKIEEILKKLWKEDDGFVSIERISYNKALQDIQYEIDKLEIKENHNGKKWIYEDVYLKEREQLYQNGINEVLENPQKYGFEKSVDITNKVEPKFKVGDWITTKEYTTPLLITNVDVINNKYEVIASCCDIKGFPKIDYIDSLYHLWTIKDVKDGNILVSDNSVFIFKEEYIGGKPTAHCGIMNGEFIQTQGGCWTNEPCHPASGADSNFLLLAIRDRGYRFDFANKELKPLSKPSIE